MNVKKAPPLQPILPNVWHAARRARVYSYRLLHRDRGGDPERAVAIFGSGRGGTTWLGSLIASGLGARIVFEPFHPSCVPRGSRFGLHPYRRPDEPDDELLDFCQRAFGGLINTTWVNRQPTVLRPDGRVVKCVRANLLVGWLREWLPEVPKVMIVRHPAAVVLSRMEAGWKSSMDFEALLADEHLVEDHLREQADWARALATDEERHAFAWAVHHLVPLARGLGDGIELVFYEDLVRTPDDELRRIFRGIGRAPSGSERNQVSTPSFTSHGDSAVVAGSDKLHRWESRLGATQVRRILDVVERFQLDWLYGAGVLPSDSARRRLAYPGTAAERGEA
ncbi:MAG: sulfotransferase [Gemmatimonadota bacterium]